MSNLDIVAQRAVVETETPAAPSSYVDWASVLAGTFVATAIFVTLTTFGSAIGLSLTSPYAGQGFSGKATAVAVAIWTVWVIVSSYLAGGYIAGRLRHRSYDSTEHESEIRNGAHGLTAWALATLLGAALTASAVGISHRGSDPMSSGMTATGSDHARYEADTLLRSERAGAYDEGLHREVAGVLQTGAYTGSLSGDDRAYLSRLVAARTGAAPADADRRVDAAVTNVRDTVNSERKTGVLVAFLTAASLALGAAAAWWSATMGGKHRDENIGYGPFTRWN